MFNHKKTIVRTFVSVSALFTAVLLSFIFIGDVVGIGEKNTLGVEYSIEEGCGDGAIDTSSEVCDDGNTTSGDGCSSQCAIESEYTCQGEPSVCLLSPGIPTNLATSAGNERVTVTWTASPQAVQYNIYRKVGNAASYLYLTQTNVTAYTDIALTNGTIYSYKLSALNAYTIESGLTSAVSATPAQASPSPICNDGTKNRSEEECDTNDFGAYNGTCVGYSSQFLSGTLICTSSCIIDTSSCVVPSVCGDGTINTTQGEACDDSNTTSGDGCSSQCSIESAYTCQGEPSVCSYVAPAPTPTSSPTTAPTPTSTPDISIPTFEKPIKDMTIEELKAKIAEILTAINKLKLLLAQIRGVQEITGIPTTFRFERNLRFGQNLQDIRYLQILFNSDSSTRIAQSGFGSPGRETIHLGPLTRKAVIRFQEKYAQEILSPYGITRGTGFVGKTTRAKLNELLTQ